MINDFNIKAMREIPASLALTAKKLDELAGRIEKISNISADLSEFENGLYILLQIKKLKNRAYENSENMKGFMRKLEEITEIYSGAERRVYDKFESNAILNGFKL